MHAAAPYAEAMQDKPASQFEFRLHGTGPDGPTEFGCVAPDEATALSLASANGMIDVTIKSAVPLAEDKQPGAWLERIRGNPLLGPDWLPMAETIAQASEAVRRRGFWRMNTYPRHTGGDPAPAPYVQGLVEWSGEHYLEVGGLATGPDWTDSETHAALTLLGWSSGSEDSGANLTRHFDTTWTGLSVSESVLSLFASVYGFTLDVPVSFDGTDEIRQVARQRLEVVSEPDVVITPGYDRPNPTIRDRVGDGDTKSSLTAGHETDFGDDLSERSRDAIRQTVESLGFSRNTADSVMSEFERQFFDGPPSHDLDGVCEPAEEAEPILDVVQVRALLERSSEELAHLSRAAQALESMTAGREHVDDFVELWAVLAATNPQQRLDWHSSCSNYCILNHTMTRVLVAACSSDEGTVRSLREDSCVLVRRAAEGRELAVPQYDSSMRKRARSKNSACGPTCERGVEDMRRTLADAGLRSLQLDPAIAGDIRKFDIWHWATQPSPSPLHDYQPLNHDYLRGPIPDQFSLSHGGHGANSHSLNVRLATGAFAMHGQTAWGGAYTGAPPSTPKWLAICQVADALVAGAGFEWLPSRFARRRWLVTFSDLRKTANVPVSMWGIEWIGEGEPPEGIPRNSCVPSPDELVKRLQGIRAAEQL